MGSPKGPVWLFWGPQLHIDRPKAKVSGKYKYYCDVIMKVEGWLPKRAARRANVFPDTGGWCWVQLWGMCGSLTFTVVNSSSSKSLNVISTQRSCHTHTVTTMALAPGGTWGWSVWGNSLHNLLGGIVAASPHQGWLWFCSTPPHPIPTLRSCSVPYNEVLYVPYNEAPKYVLSNGRGRGEISFHQLPLGSFSACLV